MPACRWRVLGVHGVITMTLLAAAAPSAALTRTPLPSQTPTITSTCGPTATPYCADHCVPCPTIRAGCYTRACGECHENPVCAPDEVCVRYGSGSCCTCATPTVYPGPSVTPVASPGPETPVAARCAGDCNGDGVITIDELIAAVAEALGTAAVDACPSADRDGDGAVRIDELIALVGAALEGCALVPIVSVEGIYDVEATHSGPFGEFPRSGLAFVEHRGNRLVVGIQFDILNAMTLTAEVPPDGTLLFDGGGFEGGDIAFSLHGSGAFTAQRDAIRLDAVVDIDSFVSGPARLTARITRPTTGTPPAYGGTHLLELQHAPFAGAPYFSQIALAIDVPASGRAACAATQDVRSDGLVLATLPAVECHVSPLGRFRYYASYDNGDQFPLPLQLFGQLGSDPSELGAGMFYIAQFPGVRERGIWTDRRSD